MRREVGANQGRSYSKVRSAGNGGIKMISYKLRRRELFKERAYKEDNLDELDKVMLEEIKPLVELIVATIRGVSIKGNPKAVEAAEDYIIAAFEEYEKEYFSADPKECIAKLMSRRPL
jgi:hypothetical protein